MMVMERQNNMNMQTMSQEEGVTCQIEGEYAEQNPAFCIAQKDKYDVCQMSYHISQA